MKELALITLVSSIAAGCATSGDVENIQGQIDGLKTSVAQVSSDAAAAQSAAADAKAAAERAEQASKDINIKLDKRFWNKIIK